MICLKCRGNLKKQHYMQCCKPYFMGDSGEGSYLNAFHNYIYLLKQVVFFVSSHKWNIMDSMLLRVPKRLSRMHHAFTCVCVWERENRDTLMRHCYFSQKFWFILFNFALNITLLLISFDLIQAFTLLLQDEGCYCIS